MANLFKPPSYMDLYAYCIDDDKPKFVPDQWVIKNHVYRVKFLCESLNTDGLAVTIVDKEGEEIRPSDSMSSFRAERFSFFELFLN